jgi:hypothetical protein
MRQCDDASAIFVALSTRLVLAVCAVTSIYALTTSRHCRFMPTCLSEFAQQNVLHLQLRGKRYLPRCTTYCPSRVWTRVKEYDHPLRSTRERHRGSRDKLDNAGR